MKREEPSSRLVDSLILKWIMNLCIWHCSGIKPNVDEVEFPLHWLACGGDKHYLVYIGSVEVDFVIVSL